MDINKYDPKFRLHRRDLLGLTDLTPEEIFELLYAAKAMKKKFRVHENSAFLRGKTVALLFGSASTRTRVSFEMGIRQMGGDYIYLSNRRRSSRAGNPSRTPPRCWAATASPPWCCAR